MANVDVPTQTGVVTALSVTVGLGVTVNVTSPLCVFGPHAGEPVVDIVTRDITVFELKLATVVKLKLPLPEPVIVLADEPSITLADQV